MGDPFALLAEPRRPWLDAERLKQKFLSLSGEIHPDRVHNASPSIRETADTAYAGLNSAYQVLKDPKLRLKSFLELEQGGALPEVQLPPPALMERAFEIGKVCREVDAFLGEGARITSPLLKVRRFEQGQDFAVRLMEIQGGIAGDREKMLTELQALDQAWEVSGTSATMDRPIRRVEEIYRHLGYYDRWSQQLQERIVQLAS